MATPLMNGALTVAAGSSAFAALIWWVVPISGLIGGIGYVVWISKYKSKFEQETFRSVGQFSRFQESFRDKPQAQAQEIPPVNPPESNS